MNDVVKQLWCANSPRYGFLPVEAPLDKRLNETYLRLLLGLILHANAHTGICVVTRETLAEWAGVGHVDTVSKMTTQLVEWGWLKRKEQSGRNRPNRYELALPKLAAADKRVITRRMLSDAEYAQRKAALDQKTAEWNRQQAAKDSGQSVILVRRPPLPAAKSPVETPEPAVYHEVPGHSGLRVRVRVRENSVNALRVGLRPVERTDVDSPVRSEDVRGEVDDETPDFHDLALEHEADEGHEFDY